MDTSKAPWKFCITQSVMPNSTSKNSLYGRQAMMISFPAKITGHKIGMLV